MLNFHFDVKLFAEFCVLAVSVIREEIQSDQTCSAEKERCSHDATVNRFSVVNWTAATCTITTKPLGRIFNAKKSFFNANRLTGKSPNGRRLLLRGKGIHIADRVRTRNIEMPKGSTKWMCKQMEISAEVTQRLHTRSYCNEHYNNFAVVMATCIAVKRA